MITKLEEADGHAAAIKQDNSELHGEVSVLKGQ